MARELSPLDYDEMISVLLGCDDPLTFERELAAFSRRHGRDVIMGIKEGERYLKRCAIRRNDYVISEDGCREDRRGKDWTWSELRVMRWAFKEKHAETQINPTARYIAHLLQRSEEEVAEKRQELRMVRGGMRGFNL